MLVDFYKANKVPDKDRIPLEKNILFVVPSKDYDLKPVLERLGLSKYEVAVTWPKESVNLLAEGSATKADLKIQVGGQFCRQWYSLPDDGSLDKEFAVAAAEALRDKYVCIHHHDEFSIKDGLGTVDQLVRLLKAQRRSFCCITNHGSVGGWVKQYGACRKAGIKAIFGCEFYVSNYRGDDTEERKKHRRANHLVVVARTMEGFENIIKIHNDAQIDGFYYSPRANREAFKQWGKGIIGSTACMAGEIPRLLMEGKKDEALETYQFYASVFDKFYIEIQIIEYEMQREANRRLIEFAREVGAPLLLTCDSHYLESGHVETHDILLCIRQHKTLFDSATGEEKDDVWNFDVKNLYYRTDAQMRDVFENGFVEKDGSAHAPFKDDVFTEEVFQEAMANTRALALLTDDIKLDSTVKLPRLYDDSKGILRTKVNEGFSKRWAAKVEEAKAKGKKLDPELQQVYLDRVRHEFRIITKLGWADYFLVMEKIISETKKEFGEWSTGYGRGSAAGSLVSYCLELTEVDPIQYGLLFERFLDESRPSPPDIDTDFDPRRREWVKQRVVQLFGDEHVCSIGTYQTYKTRAVILDVARALGEDVIEANNVTKLIDPLETFEDEEGDDIKVDKISFDELAVHYPELGRYFVAHPLVRQHAEILRNQVKNMGTHAGGVIISDINLKGKIPILYDKPGSDERKVISAWAEAGGNEELSSVGLVKFDILGLNNLPIVSDCVKLIETNQGKKVRRCDIPIDDRIAIHMGSKKDMVGIFQLDNPATKSVADAVEMESLEDVAAVTSLIRPGPRDMGMDMEYARRKHGEPYSMPDVVRELLSETYGVITYQEQCMKIVQVLGGFTGVESYKFVKAVSKKIKEQVDSFKAKFVSGCKKRIDAGELTDEDVATVWGLLEKFAGYGFNKSHAITYSALSTAEFWLRLNYPIEYITALINNTKLGKKKHGSDIFVDYVNYARRSGIEVLGPDVNKSGDDFRIENGKIRFSIGHVKNVASMASVIVACQPFASMEDFHERAKSETVNAGTGKKTSRRPNKKVVESLVEAGAFDCFGKRNDVMVEYFRLRGEKKEAPPQHTDDEWAALEKEAIGMCLSVPPICKQYEKLIKDNKWKTISELGSYKRVLAFGKIELVTPKTSKMGNSMYIVKLVDGIDELNFFVFHGAQEYFRDHFKVGTIAAVPLDKFKDGDARFYDEKGEPCVLGQAKIGTIASSVSRVSPASPSAPSSPLIKTLADGSWLFFKHGEFDSWYVGMNRPGNGECIVLDSQTFSRLKVYSDKYGKKMVFDDCRDIFDATGNDVSSLVNTMIDNKVKRYEPEDALGVELVFAFLYGTMIAEQNKACSVLKKKIKMIGIYMVLIMGMSPEYAAGWSSGKSSQFLQRVWKDIRNAVREGIPVDPKVFEP